MKVLTKIITTLREHSKLFQSSGSKEKKYSFQTLTIESIEKALREILKEADEHSRPQKAKREEAPGDEGKEETPAEEAPGDEGKEETPTETTEIISPVPMPPVPTFVQPVPPTARPDTPFIQPTMASGGLSHTPAPTHHETIELPEPVTANKRDYANDTLSQIDVMLSHQEEIIASCDKELQELEDGMSSLEQRRVKVDELTEDLKKLRSDMPELSEKEATDKWLDSVRELIAIIKKKEKEIAKLAETMADEEATRAKKEQLALRKESAENRRAQIQNTLSTLVSEITV